MSAMYLPADGPSILLPRRPSILFDVRAPVRITPPLRVTTRRLAASSSWSSSSSAKKSVNESAACSSLSLEFSKSHPSWSAYMYWFVCIYMFSNRRGSGPPDDLERQARALGDERPAPDPMIRRLEVALVEHLAACGSEPAMEELVQLASCVIAPESVLR